MKSRFSLMSLLMASLLGSNPALARYGDNLETVCMIRCRNNSAEYWIYAHAMSLFSAPEAAKAACRGRRGETGPDDGLGAFCGTPAKAKQMAEDAGYYPSWALLARFSEPETLNQISICRAKSVDEWGDLGKSCVAEPLSVKYQDPEY